jgi:hypothetical protein
VLEKPLGRDLESAQAINRVVRCVVHRVAGAAHPTHYVGKPAVQNLMALRFGNVLFEPLWRRESIASITIRIAESIGVGTRGDFYDQTGALRDMIQNHALQLLTMIAMEPPARLAPDDIHAEKLKVLRALKPFDAASVARDVVRGQIRRLPGRAEGAARQHDRDLRRAARRGAELALGRRAVPPCDGQAPGRHERGDRRAFRETPHSIFPGGSRPNKLVIKLQPEDGLELHLMAAKGTSYGEALTPVFARPRLREGVRARTASARTSACCSTRSRGRLNLVRPQRRAGGGVALGRADPARWEHEDAQGLATAPVRRRRKARSGFLQSVGTIDRSPRSRAEGPAEPWRYARPSKPAARRFM